MTAQKISFKSIKDVLTREEMSKIMAGSGGARVCNNVCKDANGVTLGTLTPSSCEGTPGPLDYCKDEWPATDQSNCACWDV